LASRGSSVTYSDIHCHVLPGLDDGPKDIEGSVALVRLAYAAGARRIVATPHFLPGLYEPTTDQIRLQLGLLRERLQRESIDVLLLEGCEAYLSERLCRDYKEGRILTIGGGSYVLVELPSMMLPAGSLEELFALQQLGAGVILAHPERNMELRRRPETVRQFVDSGMLLQVNAGSLLGVHGREAAAFASSLVADGMAHFIASDAHSGHEDLTRGGPDLRPALRRVFRREISAKRFERHAEERLNEIVMNAEQ